MKRFGLFLLSTLFIASTFLTSCSKDDDPVVGFPSIDFKGGADYTFEDVTITTNDDILVGINAAMHNETKKKLTHFKLELVSDNSSVTLVDSSFSADNFSADYMISFSETGQLTLNAKITDEDNRSDEASFQITVEEGGVKVKKNADVTLGSWNDAIGSFYDTQNEAVYTISAAKENQETVDFIFFKGATNQNTFAAPDDEDVNTIETFQLNDWTVKNETRFMLSDMTAAEFDAIGEYHIFPEFTGTGSRINNLENGDVVYFRTEAGKHGYIKVVDLYSRGDLADFEVIIEE